jgi:hypothetical protein
MNTAPTLSAKNRAICADIASELTAHPERWTQVVMARDDMGCSVASYDPRATRWCALGHVARRVPFRQWVRHPIVFALEAAMDSDISTFNDAADTTAADVARVFHALSDPT